MQEMLNDPVNKVFLIALLDQSFRSNDKQRVADQLEYLLTRYQNRAIFSHFEQLLLALFYRIGIHFPVISIPLFIRYLRNDVSSVIIRSEPPLLSRYLRSRRAEQIRVNINIIGEAVLGEEEAGRRLQSYIQTLEDPDIDYLSIKISNIFSQITPFAHQWSVDRVSERLAPIYTAAMANSYCDFNGTKQYKFINLDMEAYRDMAITIDAFMQTLCRDEFRSLSAGIALQAYLPDTLAHLETLVCWAKKRVLAGGAPIKIRLVKGANREMELCEASVRGWPCATYLEKVETDANYKMLIDYLLSAGVAPYVHTGIASHNLFDHALALTLARARDVESSYTAEMLEGVSEAAFRVLKKEGVDLILYAPTAALENFTNAIAYLVRRFDENTTEQNYLRHSFGLKVNSPQWLQQLHGFEAGLKAVTNLRLQPFRIQDRNRLAQKPQLPAGTYSFENTSDTDFTLPQNQRWAASIRNTWENIGRNGGFHAGPVIGGKRRDGTTAIEIFDKSHYHKRVVVGSYTPASTADIDAAVTIAMADADGWRQSDLHMRQAILMQVAHAFEQNRADLIGIAAAEMGKVFSESDVEVSEAIDFLNFYPYSAQQLITLKGLQTKPKGVGLVVSPWNFPIAIATGGIAAALAAGNTVILKPASNAVLCAYSLCCCFWQAGVSRSVLQFVPVSGALAGKQLIPNAGIDFVIFTGSELTACAMLKARPDLQLSAETGGKDATIVTALADRDQAIKNVVGSAFNHSGQKCSSTSLLVLEKELYEDERFKRNLIDAAASLRVGSVWDFQNRLGALGQLPEGYLKRVLAGLDEHQSWALAPAYSDSDNPYMLKPSIIWGVQSGDFCHMHELFGPVLAVMCADDLDDAIKKVNATGYGLTSGIESLDEREQLLWQEKVKAGNLYINRMTTGAIVLRQPFGGMGKSAIGRGRKAGGLNYISQFMHLSCAKSDKSECAHHPYIDRLTALLTDAGMFAAAIKKSVTTASHFAYWLHREFEQSFDYCQIRGESNVIRYRNVKSVLLRFEAGDSLYEMLSSIAAVKMAKALVYISIPKQAESEALLWLMSRQSLLLDDADRLMIQDEQALLKSMRQAERIRFLKPEHVSHSIYNDVAAEAIYIAKDPFVAHGRIELMHYFLEQSISDSYHRYGNLGLKGLT